MAELPTTDGSEEDPVRYLTSGEELLTAEREGRVFSVLDENGSPHHGLLAHVLLSRDRYATLEDTDELFVYEEDGGIYVPAEARVAADVEFILASEGTTHFVNEVLGHVRRRTYIHREAFNPPGLLCLSNGVLDLRTLELIPHTPEPRFTRQLPPAFDPEAACPGFLRFLEEIFPDAGVRGLVQCLFGYCLESGNWLQRAFMFTGSGNNGKSTLLGVLKALLGPDTVSAVTLQSLSQNRFAGATLFGKLANIAADLPDAPVRFTGTFKALTGGDPITGERKFREPFTFVNEAVLVFSANNLPTVDDRTYAFWRRWILIPFHQDFTGREDRHILETLTTPEELRGILNWALEGLRKLRERGDFPADGAAGDLMEEWKRLSDSLYWFVQERVEVDAEGFVPKDDFYEDYRGFCEERDLGAKKKDWVGKHLADYVPQVRTERGPAVNGKRPWGWSGVSIPPLKREGLDSLDTLDRTHGSTPELSKVSRVSRVPLPKGYLATLIEEEVDAVLHADPGIVPRFLTEKVLRNLRNVTTSGSGGWPVPSVAYGEVHRVVVRTVRERRGA